MAEPFVVGMSAVAMMSLMATGMPDKGPGFRATSIGRTSNAFSVGSIALALSRHIAPYRSAAATSSRNRRRSSRTPARDEGGEVGSGIDLLYFIASAGSMNFLTTKLL